MLFSALWRQLASSSSQKMEAGRVSASGILFPAVEVRDPLRPSRLRRAVYTWAVIWMQQERGSGTALHDPSPCRNHSTCAVLEPRRHSEIVPGLAPDTVSSPDLNEQVPPWISNWLSDDVWLRSGSSPRPLVMDRLGARLPRRHRHHSPAASKTRTRSGGT